MADKNRLALPADIEEHKVRNAKSGETSDKMADGIIAILHRLHDKKMAMRILVLLIYKLQERREEFK
jgi:hypothetical protein